ncbi:MAG: tRNA 2-thiouridine(34) synthase MnmA [Kiritimatiellia bacterium]
MKYAVGLSGGVDSSVAALLLKEQGHEVVGITMQLWREGVYKGGDRDACFGAHEAEDIATARRFAERLGIAYRVFDCFDTYNREVIAYFRTTYLSGKTPNPCVRCNAMLKFGLLPHLARQSGLEFDKFATGHYARIVRAGDRYAVARAVDASKDQSYFLYRLSQEQLATSEFPLGGYTKREIRELARAHGLVTAERPDSQDFYSGDPNELIGEPDRPGDIVDLGGRVLGRHNGFWHYTIGQRKGLGIGGGIPFYVIDLNACRNQVIVGRADDAVKTSLEVEDLVYGALDPSATGAVPCRVKVRSAGLPKGPARLTGTRCDFPAGIAGIAPGQSAVFYAADSDEILAGGIIK